MVGERFGDLGLRILLSGGRHGESRMIEKPTELARKGRHSVIAGSDPIDQG